MRKISVFIIVAAGVAAATGIAWAGATMKSLVPAWRGAGEMTGLVAETRGKPRAGGFEVVGAGSPYPGATPIIVANDTLKSVAARSEADGYAAAQRVSLCDSGGEIQIAYTNPTCR